MTPDEVEALTQTYRDLAGMAGLIMNEGDSGFRQFDEWLAAVRGTVK